MKIKAMPITKAENDDGLLMRGRIRDQLRGLDLRVEIRKHVNFNTYGVYVLTTDPFTCEWVISQYKSLPMRCTLKDARLILEDIFKRDLGI